MSPIGSEVEVQSANRSRSRSISRSRSASPRPRSPGQNKKDLSKDNGKERTGKLAALANEVDPIRRRLIRAPVVMVGGRLCCLVDDERGVLPCRRREC